MPKMNSVCVFCASSPKASQSLKNLATDLGQKIAKKEISLVYGGTSIGLMGSLASGANKFGGKIIAIFPEIFLEKGIDFTEADEFILTEDLRERKALMEKRSDAFIALPGGVGTLDEITEILTLIQLKQISKPLILINHQNFFGPIITFFDAVIEQKLAKKKFLKSFYLAKDNDDAIDFLTNYR